MSKKLPIIAIVGRANVGKSSLFNAILERKEAIVAREAGTTRDSIMALAEYTHPDLDTSHFWLVDTAGIKDPEDDFEFTIQEQITQAAESADVIWVVVEADVPIVEEDRRVAKMALKSRKPVFLVINKVDKAKGQDLTAFLKLGIKDIFHTSTTQNRGIDQMLDKLMEIIPQVSERADDDRLHIALLGRPNVGKSSLFNTLAKKQQAIVADKAGTTRDVNRAIVKYHGREVEIMDTAGIRRSGKIETGIERFSVVRALAAIEQADICLLLMDANELGTALDQKIAGLVKEAGKGLVLVVSKWDTVKHEKAVETETESGDIITETVTETDPFARDRIAAEIAQTYDFVPWAPLIFTSAVTGQNVTKIFDVATEIDTERGKRLPTVQLNKFLREMVDQHPPAGLKNRLPKLNYMVQETDNPIPAFKIFASHTKYIHWSYRRYLERGLRERYGYAGTPIQIWFIEKHETHKHGNSPTLAPRSTLKRKIDDSRSRAKK
ncbi:MAG TPA: ribosome biogenesis GTPase Der [Candidatus Saccharimonadales bacterium]|nr:ribosome biogenesis GTPase Der [Candidatus Saccharimonadales bacterium]